MNDYGDLGECSDMPPGLPHWVKPVPLRYTNYREWTVEQWDKFMAARTWRVYLKRCALGIPVKDVRWMWE